jgi:hypothetical protein
MEAVTKAVAAAIREAETTGAGRISASSWCVQRVRQACTNGMSLAALFARGR